MLTSVSHSLFDRLIEAFPPNRPYERGELRRDPMPGSVAAYLEHLLELKLQEAIEADLPEDVWVDTFASEVKAARANYVAVMKRHQAIPALAWGDALRTACRDTLRYLVRPASTLTDAVFHSSSTSVRAEDVFARIDFYEAYPYFRSVIEAYFQQKDAARIDRDRFEGLVKRIDRQMTGDFDSHQWRELLDPLARVLSAAGMREIPVEILKVFFQEKEADGPLQRLKRRYGLEGSVPVDALEDLFVPEKAAAGESERRTERDTERRIERAAAPRTGDESVPLWKQFEEGFRPATPERSDRRHAEAGDGSPEPLWKQFRKPAEPSIRADGGGLSDVERAVLGERGARNRDLFIKHLFSGRRQDYESTLRRLAHAASWSQASQIIAQEVFLKHQVNIYSDPAVAFTDAAEAQYRS